MIVEELYDALIEAGASEAKAKAASRAVADMEKHFSDLQRDIYGVRQEISELRSEVHGKLRLYDWMLGTILAFLIAVFFKVFSR